jgi:hypothetical protein
MSEAESEGPEPIGDEKTKSRPSSGTTGSKCVMLTHRNLARPSIL